MSKDNDLNTKDKIFRAAVSVFAEKGFHAATVREICARAGANVAAVNYHYGAKEKLYAEVLDFVFAGSDQAPRAALATPAEGPAEERLAAFIRAFVRSIYQSCAGFDDCELGAVFLYEMARPSPGLDRIVERYIRPDADVLRALVREYLGPAAPAETVWACGGSIVGQALYYCAIGPIVERLRPDSGVADSFLDDFAGHVTRFSLGGLEAVRRSLAAA